MSRATPRPAPPRRPDGRRGGKNAITHVVGRRRAGPHDLDTLLELLGEFPGIPLTYADVRGELGWSEERTRHAAARGEAAGVIECRQPDKISPIHIHRLEREESAA